MKKQGIILLILSGILVLGLGVLLGSLYYQNTLPRTSFSSLSLSIQTSNTSSSSPSTSINSSVTTESSNSQSSLPVANLSLYFHKDPESSNDFTSVFSVPRSTTRVDVGTFLLEQYLAGPTTTEISTGLYSMNKLLEESNCGGPDFTLSITSGKATVKLCKPYSSAGVGDDARFTSAVTMILKQFPTVSSVVILTNNGDCFGDASGLNLCLNP